jgi:hypothetical protein
MNTNDLLTTAKAAEFLGIKPRTISGWRHGRSGYFPDPDARDPIYGHPLWRLHTLAIWAAKRGPGVVRRKFDEQAGRRTAALHSLAQEISKDTPADQVIR